MSHFPRSTVFVSEDVRIEIFRSEDGARLEAVVIHAVPRIGVLRMPLPEGGNEGDTIPSEAVTSS